MGCTNHSGSLQEESRSVLEGDLVTSKRVRRWENQARCIQYGTKPNNTNHNHSKINTQNRPAEGATLLPTETWVLQLAPCYARNWESIRIPFSHQGSESPASPHPTPPHELLSPKLQDQGNLCESCLLAYSKFKS